MTREIRGLHEAAYLLAFFTFFSQILALVRDRTFAHFFGAGPTLDSYFAAFRIPDVVFAFLTLFVSAFAIIPLLAEHGGHESKESRRLIGGVLVVFGFTAIAISALLFFAIPNIVPKLFPGFDSLAVANVIELSRIMLLQPIFLGFSSIVASVIQASRRFFIYALAPIFYNVGIIFGALFLYPHIGISGLAWGVVIGAVLHLGVQIIPFAMHSGLWKPVVVKESFRDVLRVCILSLPRALALSANQVLLLVFASAASLAVTGSVAVISFGFNLQSVPLSIIGVSYASALFPALALLFSSGKLEKFSFEVWTAIRHIIFWITPAIALIVVLRAHMVRVILGSGAFGWDETRLTAAVFAIFALSLIAQGAILVFSRAYYAAGRSIEPIAINVLSAIFAGVIAFAGVGWFQQATVSRFFLEDLFRISNVPGSEVIMIAVAYTGVLLVTSVVFAVVFSVRFGFEKRTLQTIFHSFSASVLGAITTYGVLQLFAPVLQVDTFLGIFIQGAVAGVFGILVWSGALMLLKNPEFSEALLVLRRFFKKKTNSVSN